MKLNMTVPEWPEVILELDGLLLFAARQRVSRVVPGTTKIRRLTQRLIRLNAELDSYRQPDGDDEEESEYDVADYYDEIVSIGGYLESTYYDLVRAFRPSWQHCGETIILAALSIEAHMNRRILELVKGEREQERLRWSKPPHKKMQKILNYLSKREFGATNRTFKAYQKVVKYRNNLAHYKPKLMFYDDGRPPKLPSDLGLIPREARRAVQVAEDLIEDFSKRLGGKARRRSRCACPGRRAV